MQLGIKRKLLMKLQINIKYGNKKWESNSLTMFLAFIY